MPDMEDHGQPNDNDWGVFSRSHAKAVKDALMENDDGSAKDRNRDRKDGFKARRRASGRGSGQGSGRARSGRRARG